MRNEEIHEDDPESDLDAGGDESGLHFLDAAEKSLDAIRDSGHEIEYRHYFQVVCADLRHSTAPEQTDDRIPEEKDHKTDEYAVAKFQDHAFSESFPHLISVPGTVALTCIIHDGMADALLRNACKIINPVYSIEGGKTRAQEQGSGKYLEKCLTNFWGAGILLPQTQQALQKEFLSRRKIQFLVPCAKLFAVVSGVQQIEEQIAKAGMIVIGSDGDTVHITGKTEVQQ